MDLTAMRSALRTELKDTASNIWSDSELDRAVEKAVSDLDRFFPLEKMYEITLDFEVKDEVWTAGSAAGAWVQLKYKPIAWNSETVKDSAGETCERDVDYYIDYIGGQITEGKHVVIHYLTQNAPPTAAGSGSFPRHLDEVVLKGAAGYACLMAAIHYEHRVKDKLADAATAFSNAATALGKVETYITGDIAPSSKKYLTDGDDYLTTVNVAAEVPENYAIYAQRSADISVALIREGSEYTSIGNGNVSVAAQYQGLADRLRTEGLNRLQEFLTILSERSELRGRTVTTVSPRQVRT